MREVEVEQYTNNYIFYYFLQSSCLIITCIQYTVVNEAKYTAVGL